MTRVDTWNQREKVEYKEEIKNDICLVDTPPYSHHYNSVTVTCHSNILLISSIQPLSGPKSIHSVSLSIKWLSV